MAVCTSLAPGLFFIAEFVCHAIKLYCVRAVVFCNLIGGAQSDLQIVSDLTPQCSQCAARLTEPGCEAVFVS